MAKWLEQVGKRKKNRIEHTHTHNIPAKNERFARKKPLQTDSHPRSGVLNLSCLTIAIFPFHIHLPPFYISIGNYSSQVKLLNSVFVVLSLKITFGAGVCCGCSSLFHIFGNLLKRENQVKKIL